MKELKFEELSVRQKLGMVTCGLIPFAGRTDAGDEYTLEMIRNRELGSVWVNPNTKNADEIMARIKEAADYPILIMTDAESGLPPYTIGKHNALGMTDNEEHSYIFGKLTAITARKMGYNVVCNPILDRIVGPALAGGNVRALGSDKYKIAALGKAQARGMHDGGVLTVGKHYPSAAKGIGRQVDTHMAESTASETREELINDNLYPYLELNKEGLLDGIMTAHTRFVNIDDKYPASLSKEVIGIIREQGFKGFAITDALSMMGVVAKFGLVDSKGIAVENGNDIALVWTTNTKDGFEAICDCYERGIISDERLDEAVKVVLETQHKAFTMRPKYEDITDEDIELFKSISRDAVYARTDDGIPTALSRDGKHYFIVMVDNDVDINEHGKVDVDTFNGGWHGGWYNPKAVMDMIKENFPNSDSVAIRQFPSGANISKVLSNSMLYDDVVLITYYETAAYIGRECLTSRIISLIDALQVTNRVSTVVHFGNPYVLCELAHIPRILIGTGSVDGVSAMFDVMSGRYPAKGVLTYDVTFE